MKWHPGQTARTFKIYWEIFICWPTGTVYVHSLTYASTAADGRIHYSARIFAGDRQANCTLKTYTSGRVTLSANRQTMLLQWLDGSGYTETYTRM